MCMWLPYYSCQALKRSARSPASNLILRITILNLCVLCMKGPICFGMNLENPFNMETYDTVVEYRKWSEWKLRGHVHFGFQGLCSKVNPCILPLIWMLILRL